MNAGQQPHSGEVRGPGHPVKPLKAKRMLGPTTGGGRVQVPASPQEESLNES